MRVESPPGDENVGLALHQPEELAEEDGGSEADDLAATAEIEARPYEQASDNRQPDRARPEQRDRRIDECPHAIARERARERGARARERRDEIDERLAPEIERARHHHLGQRDERRGQKDQRLHAQEVGNHRLAIIGRGERGAENLERGEQAVEQQQQPERLPDPERIDRIGLDERARESPAVEESEEGHDHLRHRKQAVIGGIEQANHDQSRRPGDDLRENLTARTPDNRAANAVAESALIFFGAFRPLEFRAFAHHFTFPAPGSPDALNIL